LDDLIAVGAAQTKVAPMARAFIRAMREIIVRGIAVKRGK
jgi:hypothetical protein